MEKAVLLAEEESGIWDFGTKIKDYIRQEKSIRVPLEGIEIINFRSGEFLPHVPRSIRRKEVYYIGNSSDDPSRWGWKLALMKDLLQSASAEKITFVLPDLLWSRQDRKDKPHVPISARVVATILSYPFPISRVITTDIHAGQIQGFYPSILPVDSLHSFPETVRFLKEKNLIDNLENLVITSPDAGGVVRAKAFAAKLGVQSPLSFIYKMRDKFGRVSEVIPVGEFRNKDVLFIDDIIDSGGTLCEGAKAVLERGANKLYCYAPHGLFTLGTEELRKYFKEIMTSNTHYKEGDDVRVVDLAPLFAEAIYRAQVGESISELFKIKE